MISENFSASAVILAAGSSRRMGDIDKTLVVLEGKPLISWAVEAFEQCSSVEEIVVVAGPGNLEKLESISSEMGWRKVSRICLGGARRQDSVLEGIRCLKGQNLVAIHDGARPFVTAELIERGLASALETGASIAAVPVKDTIKVVGENDRIVATPDRSKLWAAQTPQIFMLRLLVEAYGKVQGDVTDDASLLEGMGHPVKVFQGSYFNIKVTTPEDLVLASAIAKYMAEQRER